MLMYFHSESKCTSAVAFDVACGAGVDIAEVFRQKPREISLSHAPPLADAAHSSLRKSNNRLLLTTFLHQVWLHDLRQ